MAKSKKRNSKIFGERIARLRSDKGMTQTELARRLGRRQSMVSEYETGLCRLHGDLIIELTRIFDTSADYILGIESAGRPRRFSNYRLLHQIQRIEELPPRDRDALLRTIDVFLDRRGDKTKSSRPNGRSRRGLNR